MSLPEFVAAVVNAIDPDRGWKVDLIVRRDRPFSVEEFSRRQGASVLGVELHWEWDQARRRASPPS